MISDFSQVSCKVLFDAAQDTLAGLELMRMLKKGQMVGTPGEKGLTAAEQFYSLAA